MSYDQDFLKQTSQISGSIDCLKIATVCKSFLGKWYLEANRGESILEFIRSNRKRLLPRLSYKATGKYKRGEDRWREEVILKIVSGTSHQKL
jgi:hypothetical protein